MNKQYIINIIESIAISSNIKLVLAESLVANSDIPYGGIFYEPNTIHINTGLQSAWGIAIAFFHELGHWFAYNNDIFPIYHNKDKKRFNRRDALATSTRAERWVDNWGRNMCKQILPNIKWVHSYRTIKDIAFLKKCVKSWF